MTEDDRTGIYEDFRGKVFGYLLHRLGGNMETEAEDLCSEVFLKVYEKLDSFDQSKASLSTWIYTITRNTLIDYFRTRHILSELTDDLPGDRSVDPDPTPEDKFCTRESLDELASALRSLDAKRRDVIILRYYSGRSLTDIAREMGLSYSYVKSLHLSALEKLKHILN